MAPKINTNTTTSGMIDDYLGLIMKDGAKLLLKSSLKFPKQYTIEKRIELYQNMINYFESKEEYRICASLEKPLYKLIIKQKEPKISLKKLQNVTGSSI